LTFEHWWAQLTS
nr:Chain P, pDI6W peptide (12mer) [synthetic construct]3JZR_P Chain P, pDI6W peptide (12mer) [synthetic construct]